MKDFSQSIFRAYYLKLYGSSVSTEVEDSYLGGNSAGTHLPTTTDYQEQLLSSGHLD